MKDGSVISAFKTLKSFEKRLPKDFIRVHQSYILNSRYVSRINYGKSICSLKYGEEEELPFSKTYKDKIDSLKEMLSKTATKARLIDEKVLVYLKSLYPDSDLKPGKEMDSSEPQALLNQLIEEEL